MIKRGATRSVWLIGRWAIKVPRTVSWRLFLTGLLANMQERQFSRTGWPELCPVLFSLPGGWLVVMQRAEPLTADEFSSMDVVAFLTPEGYSIPAEPKADSFGKIGDRVVAVDYGS